jgi:dienelactone hydrolase
MVPTSAGHVVAGGGEGVVAEQALQLGPDGHLVGVLARPATGVDPERPVVVMLNAGVLHRVGPHRLHVVLARRLAERGVTSLRLDLSGIGDSRPVPGSLSFRASAVADARTAMDWLAADAGARRFILFGLCSGADNALATAAADHRVAGIVLVDPPAYATAQARRRRVVRRVQQLGGVREIAAWGAAAVARRVRRRLSPAGRAPAVEVTGGREVPPAAEYRAQLAALLARGVAIFSIYSGALGERYNHEGQLFELYPELRGRVDCRWFAGANHMFTELAAQRALIAAIVDWIGGR